MAEDNETDIDQNEGYLLNPQRTTITTNGVTWAVKIAWSTLPRPLETVSIRKIKDTAKAENMTLFVRSSAYQYGLTSEHYDHKKKMPSLAKAIQAKTKAHNAVFLFKLGHADPTTGEEEYYLLIIRDNAIQTHTDEVLPAGLARNIITTEMTALPELDHFIAPEGATDKTQDHRTLAEFLETISPRSARLQPISNRDQNIALASGLAALAVGLGIYKGWQHYTDIQLQKQAQQEQIREEQEETEKKRLSTPVMPANPAAHLPMAIPATYLCMTEIRSKPMFLPGWTMKDITCNGELVTATYKKHDEGTINWLTPYLRPYNKPQIIMTGADIASVTWPITKNKKEWGEFKGQQSSDITRYIESQFAEAYLPYELSSPDNPITQAKTIGGDTINVHAPWTIMSLTFTQEGYVRDDLLGILSRIVGLTLTSVTYTTDKQHWDFSYSIYHYEPDPDSLTPITDLKK